MNAFDTQFLVIGAGPAGLQLGYGLQRIGADHLIVEAATGPANFFRTMPRFRGLISFNKKHSIYDDPEIALRWDWNSLLCDGELLFGDYSTSLYPHADDLCRYLSDFADRFVPNIQYGRAVRSVERRPSGEGFVVEFADGTVLCARVVVVATGIGKPFVPDIDGIELVTEHYSTVSTHAADYAGQRVLIIGKGNSAFEVADHLMSDAALIHLASPNPIQFAWQTRHAGHLRADYTRLLDSYQLKLLNSVLDCSVHEIWREGDGFGVKITYTHAEGEVDRLHYDRVILCTGFCFDPTMLGESCQPRMIHDGRLPELTPTWELAGQPDLFVAGTLMQSRDFRGAASAFIDGFRYNVRTLLHVLRERYLGVPYPSRTWAAEPEAMLDELLAWICRSSGLWAQFGYLCDVVVIERDARGRPRARHFKELPVDHVREGPLTQEPHVYQVTFEWGPWEGDVFAVDRRPRHAEAHRSAFLHPVIRRLCFGEVIDEHHMLEDLFGMWRPQTASPSLIDHDGRGPDAYHEQEHVAPLRAFFARHLRAAVPVAVGDDARQPEMQD